MDDTSTLQHDDQHYDDNQQQYDNSTGEHNVTYDDGGYHDQEYDPNAFEPIWVRAVYDFEATNDTEMSFNADDIVCITQDYNDGWWCGDLNGNIGRVPANYFEYLEQDTQDTQAYGDENAHYDSHQTTDTGGSLDNQQAQGDGDDEDDETDQGERKEMLRQKREMYKKEMKELQDKLKQQQVTKDGLGSEIDALEKEKEAIEAQVRGMRLLKYLDLEITKTDIDIELDSEVSQQARQTGLAITMDLRTIRQFLATLKSATLDQPKKQYDIKLEELEKKLTVNLTNLDVCDNLKKSVQMDLALLASEMELLLLNENLSQLPLPPPPSSTIQLPTPPSVTYNLPPPPVQAGGSFMQSTTVVLLSEKDKRKSMKEAKKQEKLESKEREREEKEKKKEKKKEEDVWRPTKVTK
ncbi:hypothetical protein SAMD00019534_080860 [Acytostelium subglobosum LB1]|uniref:hypothetical protein n=1 Tax=Acytostelium subglobosum LB1 TaxID=1410327 RepID=UPI000644EC07|nr:hypothetical protein SAMD00019534_080860 [Acytostelium subglobosum LB1]GAM24911.1 hypothetical protein SAMD00019534_080860 [Acytostelium subglobosum LB1]|eukprot:XP_012752000.1 hypothetical protein SAMD00019534_080860 [Acytostelium subglobosum LB1]